MALRVKRATDIVGAAAGGTLLLPVLAAAALAVRLRSGRPVLFVSHGRAGVRRYSRYTSSAR